MLADIVIWNRDPIADITVLQRPDDIAAIIKDGHVIDRDTLGFLPLAEEPQRARIFA
jgi:imidazolonepropionase-like amidohydrolase